MIRYYILLTLFSLFPQIITSQIISISGYVVDINKEPLSYSNVVSIHKMVGTVTDEKGYFTLMIDKSDTLKISHISSFPKIIPVSRVIGDTITLSLNLINLDEVVVYSKKAILHESQLGYYNLGRNGQFILRPGSQLATYIVNPYKKQVSIKNVSFQISEKGRCDCSIRIRLLDVNNDNRSPGIDILEKNIIVQNRKLKKFNSINISEHNVKMPVEGVFVVIEWVSNVTKCENNSYPIITGNLKTKENVVWFNFRDFQWSNKHKLGLSNNSYMTPNFYITIIH